MASTLVSDYFDYVDKAVIGFMSSSASALSQAMLAPFTMMLGFSFTVYALGLVMGWFKMPMEEFLWKFAKVTLIGYFGLAAGVYSANIGSTFYAMQGEFAQVVTPTGSKAPNMVIDDVLDKGLELAVAFKELASGWKPADALGLYLTALVVLLTTIIICAVAAGLILLTKFLLGVLLATGTLFILCLAFNWSHKLFDGWMSQVLNYMLMFLFLSIAVNLLFAMWAAGLLVAKGDVANGWTALVPALFNGVVAYFVLRQIEFLTRGVTGGWHVITIDMVGRARGLAAPVLGLAGGAARSGGAWAFGAAGRAAGSANRAAGRAWNNATRSSRGTSGSGSRSTERSGGANSSRRSYDASPSGAAHTSEHHHKPPDYDKGHDAGNDTGHDHNNNVDNAE